MCNVLKSWMEAYWQDFDHDLTAQVVNFVDNLPNDQKNLVGKQIHKAILQRVRHDSGITDSMCADVWSEDQRESTSK